MRGRIGSNLAGLASWCSLRNITSCHSEPAFFAGEESAVGRAKADSSRDKTALRNDKSLKLHRYQSNRHFHVRILRTTRETFGRPCRDGCTSTFLPHSVPRTFSGSAENK